MITNQQFKSILFPKVMNIQDREPQCFHDLNIDQVVDKITKGKKNYKLEPFFYSMLTDIDSILYRQEVFNDLESDILGQLINDFSNRMIVFRRHLALSKKLRFDFHKMGWHLEAVLNYCSAVSNLATGLSDSIVKSQGFCLFRDELINYANSDAFKRLSSDSIRMKSELDKINYNIIVQGSWVRVRKSEGEKAYSEIIEQVFDRFRSEKVDNVRIDFVYQSGMSHVHEKILECVIKLYPETYKNLLKYYETHENFIDGMIQRFDREIQFYVAYLSFINNIRQTGLGFSYPLISTTDKSIFARDTYDIALADELVFKEENIVPNDFFLKDDERIIVISGPNQGGKTTFARTIGQLHFFGCLGCPVPGREVKLYLVDQVFTHFEREEEIANLRGKLKDDLVRLKQILKNITTNSLIVLNEILTSTSQEDAKIICKNILDKIIDEDCLCVCVSFIDELSTMSDKTVSMISMVDIDNPALRTFKIIRMPADGRAFAIFIAKRHGLSYEMIIERINK